MLAIFSSTAGIVSGAYLMPSRPSSSIPQFFFSNQMGSLSFYMIFPVFGLNMHNNFVPKPVGLEFVIFFFASIFFEWNFNDKKRSKLWFLAIFSKSFYYGTIKLQFTGLSGIWTHRGHILGSFLILNMAITRSKVSFFSILGKVSTGFTWKLFFKLTGTTFRSM